MVYSCSWLEHVSHGSTPAIGNVYPWITGRRYIMMTTAKHDYTENVYQKIIQVRAAEKDTGWYTRA